MKLPKIGDYVLATKWGDGDPQDHWVVGFFSEVLDYSNYNRYQVVDFNGNPFRGNGFRRIASISKKRGEWLLNNKEEIQKSYKSLWWWVKQPMSKYK